MTDEFVILSPRPIDLADQLIAAVAVDIETGFRSLFNGGANQVCDLEGAPIATVLRSKGLDVADDATRLLGAPPAEGNVFWTEGYLAAGHSRGAEFGRALAATVEGQYITIGGES